MTDAKPSGTVSLDDLPLAHNRTAGWNALRASGEVVECDDAFALTSIEAITQACKNPEIFSSARAFDMLGSPLPLVPIAIDPPEHARFRRILDGFFAPKRLRLMEPTLRAQAGQIIDGLVAQGTCEAVADFAIPYPTQVFLTLFGLPLEDRDKLVRWKDAIINIANPGEAEAGPEGLERAAELYTYLSAFITERRHTPGDDLLSQLLALRDEGGMSDEEIIGLGFLFVLAGLDTVTSALSFMFAALGADKALRARLYDDPSSIPTFIEEMLRFEVPVPFVPRVTTADVTVCGRVIPEGSQVMVGLGAANRDPARFVDADVFDPDREKAPHFAFGLGVHRCLGSHLARIELEIVLDEWHRRVGDYELAPGAVPTVPWPAGTLAVQSVPLVLRSV